MKKGLAKLGKIELRTIWNHEAADFTSWLAEQDNLTLLSEEIGIPIKHLKTEADVGRFNVDILAEEEDTGRKIIIENQLEITNHDHLGKIITYASGYDAEIVIWIVKNIRDEHQKAIEWLNDHTDENINFFLIKVELWKIENSKPAVKFNLIVSPNKWAKVIKGGASGAITETKIKQQQFWTRFKEYVNKRDSKMKLRTPNTQHWFNISIGSSKAHISLTVNTRENVLGCGIYIRRDKEMFHFLKKQKTKIEGKVGKGIEWIDAEIASRIVLKKPVSSIFDEQRQDEYFSWLYEKAFIFQKLFGQMIKEFDEK